MAADLYEATAHDAAEGVAEEDPEAYNEKDKEGEPYLGLHELAEPAKHWRDLPEHWRRSPVRGIRWNTAC